MSPIPAINPNLMSSLPSMDSMMSPNATTLPGMGDLGAASMGAMNGIQMPAELASVPASSAHFTQPVTNSFGSMLHQFVADVNTKQAEAAQSVNALQSGQTIPLHKAVIAMEEANVSFQLMVEVRNRLLDSYQEIMRMQV